MLRGNMPSGPDFVASISRDIIALRVGDRVCLAAPAWMSLEQVAHALYALRVAIERPM